MRPSPSLLLLLSNDSLICVFPSLARRDDGQSSNSRLVILISLNSNSVNNVTKPVSVWLASQSCSNTRLSSVLSGNSRSGPSEQKKHGKRGQLGLLGRRDGQMPYLGMQMFCLRAFCLLSRPLSGGLETAFNKAAIARDPARSTLCLPKTKMSRKNLSFAACLPVRSGSSALSHCSRDNMESALKSDKWKWQLCCT